MTGDYVVIFVKVLEHFSGHGSGGSDVHIYLLGIEDELIPNSLPKSPLRKTGINEGHSIGGRLTRHVEAQRAACCGNSGELYEMSPVDIRRVFCMELLLRHVALL